jgi:hypothetical protein
VGGVLEVEEVEEEEEEEENVKENLKLCSCEAYGMKPMYEKKKKENLKEKEKEA